MSETFNPKDSPNVTFLKVREEFIQYEEGMLDPAKRYEKSDNVIYEMNEAQIAEHIATTVSVPMVVSPIEMANAFIRAYAPPEMRMQLGAFMQQAVFHYEWKDMEALVLFFDSLAAAVPQEALPIVTTCRSFFEV